MTKITKRPLEGQIAAVTRWDSAATTGDMLGRDLVELHAAARTADALDRIAKTLEGIERALWGIAPERIDL